MVPPPLPWWWCLPHCYQCNDASIILPPVLLFLCCFYYMIILLLLNDLVVPLPSLPALPPSMPKLDATMIPQPLPSPLLLSCFFRQQWRTVDFVMLPLPLLLPLPRCCFACIITMLLQHCYYYGAMISIATATVMLPPMPSLMLLL